MTNEIKPLYNSVCAYRHCKTNSSVRLDFALGFSALFCNHCAKILTDANLAKYSVGDKQST